MQLALELASCARGRTSPNPMVGAVLVRDDVIVGRGWHQRAGEPHAEILALKDAGEAARGATMYVSLEPCCHTGRTGPCTEAVIGAGVSRVIVAMRDPNPLVAGKGITRLRDAGIEVTDGVLESEARSLNEVFIKYITRRLPFVVLKAAVSLDGKIATHTGDSRWITGSEAREYGHRLRDTYDAILVGAGTVRQDDPSLTARLPGARDPVRIVLDSRGTIPPTARVITQTSDAPTLVAVTAGAPEASLKALESTGAGIVVAGEGSRVDLPLLMRELAARQITSVLVEGGGQVHASFIAARLPDKVVWFIAPKIIGGIRAPGAVSGLGAERMADVPVLDQVTVKRLGQDICIEGYFPRTQGAG
ncbi:MAG: bifunctional diaminohydroxyphosphoribosylaminopyrimidine deaminase/5-amino-6-(5-phosphoribosylamino)uracil reductase RibD [Desulforudis sp.]|nr:bifunctional diaminohydroxyphosphoribosylaminopyrimidine deaminase/5-amino-6-(5-phosphoribosylamino)uracil reductase RibD [Clostridia bacterium]MDQ7791127.1 bifunctional diaminohydroxyphosphoribosylaminopyrimidine deaminase/5-amino-6-(5-phosphoribosylamino)uracil reductase RibD [Clostridia bacterium]RJX17920.1 MAG: bifunctional diaminohydroxyphosphoribosylaminopyrimidine deaminase/5-amino-6-(5-phosphoribosylamino)uracil reductase RibD [Desulforudis sp.]